jgi:hypothetical protein
MINYAIGISEKSFNKINNRFNPTLKGNATPVSEGLNCPMRTTVLPENF